MDPVLKQLATIGVVILLFSGLGLFLYVRSGGKPDGEGPDGKLPIYDMPPNVPVTTLGNDNNEPSIAISPIDPMTMVAGSNDYNTPVNDA